MFSPGVSFTCRIKWTTKPTLTHPQMIWFKTTVSSSQCSPSFGCSVIALCITCSSLWPPSSARRLFLRSLIGNWSCLTGSDSLCCCCALSALMWRSVFIGNLHKSRWENGRPGTWSSLMAQPVLADDQHGDTMWRDKTTLEQKWLLRNNYCIRGAKYWYFNLNDTLL